jgi:hypothetical protein
MIRRHDVVVLGVVIAGGRVVRAADVLGHPVELLGLEIARALEHQMLEEMREARAAFGIVLAADVVPDLDADRRTGMILERDDAQPVA